MLGFLVFYGLESMVARPRRGAGNTGDHHGSETPWQAWVHIGGFAFYTWLITFQIGQTGKGLVAFVPFRGGHGPAHRPDHEPAAQ